VANLHTNINKLYAFSFLQRTLFPMAIITLFWKDQIGLSLTEILLLQSIFSFGSASSLYQRHCFPTPLGEGLVGAREAFFGFELPRTRINGHKGDSRLSRCSQVSFPVTKKKTSSRGKLKLSEESQQRFQFWPIAAASNLIQKGFEAMGRQGFLKFRQGGIGQGKAGDPAIPEGRQHLFAPFGKRSLEHGKAAQGLECFPAQFKFPLVKGALHNLVLDEAYFSAAVDAGEFEVQGDDLFPHA
jgi:hypothetical protein